MMKTVFKISAVTALLLLGANAAPAFANPLSGAEISQLLNGATVSGETSKGRKFTIRYKDDGSARFKFRDGSFSDRGQWVVEGDA